MPSSGVQTCALRSEEHTSELQSHDNLVCRLLLETKKHTSELQSHDNLVCRLLLEQKTHSPAQRGASSHSAALKAGPRTPFARSPPPPPPRSNPLEPPPPPRWPRAPFPV